METDAETVKRIIDKIVTEFQGFSSAEIGSQVYKAKGAAIEELINSLARLHPRWSAEEETIVPWSEESANLTENGEDPLYWTFRYSEELILSWREMEADHPTVDSLSKGFARFHRALRVSSTE